MSKLDIINDEITRRQNANIDLLEGNKQIAIVIEQFNKLDEMYRADEKKSRDALESRYLENRHFTGNWPIVYAFGATEKYPFYGGASDNQCNPYFPVTQAQNGSHDGLSPINITSSYDGTNLGVGNNGTSWNRIRSYGLTIEPTLRNTALVALSAFPDISGETGVGSCSGETPSGSGVDETTCLSNGGVWTPPGYPPGSTATEKLRAALTPWKTEIESILIDLSMDDGTEESFWQNILNNINNILSNILIDVVYPANTVDFILGSTADIARNYLLAEQTNINTHIIDRSTFLQDESNTEEQMFAGVLKLRLHQANGSFAKQKAAKGQLKTNTSIINDNLTAIKSLNILKVKSS